MGRLILHMGGHKTGSSAVQLWLTQNAEALRKAGILFPKAFVGRTGNGSRLARVLVLSPDRNGEIPVQRHAEFMAFCRQNPDHDIVVSAERFESELLPSLKAGRDPKDSEQAQSEATEALLAKVAERLDRIRSFAQDAGLSGVTMVYLIRNLVDRTSSGFAQKVKALTRNAFEEANFDPLSAPYRDHAACNQLMEEYGFEVAMDALDPSAVSVVDQVMRLAGLSERVAAVADVVTPRANESIGQLGVLAGMHLGRVVAHGPQDGLLRRRRAFSAALRESCTGIADAPFSGFRPEDAAIVARTQAALNEALGPWMAPERRAMVAEPRRTLPRSPLAVEDLDEDQAQVVQQILGRVADIMCGGEMAELGYSRDEIMAIGSLAGTAKPSKRGSRTEKSAARPRAKKAGRAPGKAPNPAREEQRLARKASRQAERRLAKGRTAPARPSPSHDG